NRSTLIPEIQAVTATAPVAHWISVLDEAGGPCGPTQDVGQVVSDQALVDREFFWGAPHPTLGSVRQLGSPMRFSLTPARRDRAAPLLGEDTLDVLRELGYSGADGERLRSRGVI